MRKYLGLSNFDFIVVVVISIIIAALGMISFSADAVESCSKYMCI